MDATAIAGSSLLLKTSQTQQAVSMSTMKQAVEQQNQLANMLAQSAQQAPQPARGTSSFSTYA